MKITMDLIFTKLFMEHPEMTFDISAIDGSKALMGVRLLPVEKIHLKYDILYVCDNGHPIVEDGFPQGLPIVCIGEDMDSSIRNECQAFLHSHIELALFLNILQEIYTDFKDWHSMLERMVIENDTVQDMVSASEAMIKAPILIYDPSLKIIGHSEHIPVKDKIFNDVTKLGYLPSEYIEFFERDHVFQSLNRIGSSESPPKNLRQHRDYIRIIQTETDVVGHGVILLLDSANKKYQLYLFNTLCDLILDHLRLHSAQNAVYDYILSDILDYALTDSSAIADRIKYVGLPFNAEYALMLLRLEDDNFIPFKFIIHSLSTSLPWAKVFSYKGDILVLLPLQDLKATKFSVQIQRAYQAIAEELAARRLRCSVSKSFDQITKITNAYQQCQVAYALEPDEKARLILYENYWLQHLFETCSKEIPLENFVSPAIGQIAEKRQTGTASPLEILKAYLECDRQLTQAAETLHMHRNNVLYHVNKLEKEYNLELNDSDKRLYLLVSLKIWEYLKR